MWRHVCRVNLSSVFLSTSWCHGWHSTGQCHCKQEAFEDVAARFKDFAKRYPDDPLCAEALFWAGESFRMDKDVPMAFRYYNRCRWYYPESEAAKYRMCVWHCRRCCINSSAKQIWKMNNTALAKRSGSSAGRAHIICDGLPDLRHG